MNHNNNYQSFAHGKYFLHNYFEYIYRHSACHFNSHMEKFWFKQIFQYEKILKHNFELKNVFFYFRKLDWIVKPTGLAIQQAT